MEETQKHVMEVNPWSELASLARLLESQVNGEAKKQRRRMSMKLWALLSVIVTVRVAIFWTSSGYWCPKYPLVPPEDIHLYEWLDAVVSLWLRNLFNSQSNTDDVHYDCRSSPGVVYMAITEVVPPGPENDMEIWHGATSSWALKMEIRRKWLSILSLVRARREPRDRTESQKSDKSVHPAKAAPCSHSCHPEPLNKELVAQAQENIFTAHFLTGHNRKHAGVTQKHSIQVEHSHLYRY